MPENRYSPRIAEHTWDLHKAIILHLYCSENKPLTAPGGVQDTLNSQYGFFATKAQYETKLRKWRVHKYGAAYDRRRQASVLNNWEVDGLNMEWHFIAPDNSPRSLAIRTFSSQHHNLSSARLSPRVPGLIPSTSSSPWHGVSPASTYSATSSSTVFRYEVGSVFSRDHLWPQNATPDTYGLYDSRSVLGSSSSRATDLLSELFIPDIAASMIPVITHLFPQTASSAHMVLFGDSSAVESAIISISHPSALRLVREQRIDHQIIYVILHHLINHDDVVHTLNYPETELDQFFNAGIKHCFSLGPNVLSSVIKSTPAPYDLALIQGIFCAALFLGDGTILDVIMKMKPGNLSNHHVLLGGQHYMPVQYTSYFGHVQATEVLLDHGADPNRELDLQFLSNPDIFPRDHDHPNTEARVQILHMLARSGLEIDSESVVVQIERGDIGELHVLLTYCLDKSFEIFFNNHALPIFLRRKDWDDSFSKIIESIIERASCDRVGQQRLWGSVLSESLSSALLRSHTSAVEILLTKDAKLNINCLISAAYSNNVRILETCLDRGLDPNALWSRPPFRPLHRHFLQYDHNDRFFRSTALSESIKNNSRGAFQVLQAREFVAKLAHQPEGFSSAFVAACWVGDSALIEQLLSVRSHPGQLSGMGEALGAALEENQHHIIEKLITAGVKPTIRCLEEAIQNRQLSAVKILVKSMDLPDLLESEYIGVMPGEHMMSQLYGNTIIFGALQWGDQEAVEQVLSMEYPVDTIFHLMHNKLSDWNLAPGLYPPGYNSDWFLTPLSAAILKGITVATNALMACGAQAVAFNSLLTSYQSRFLSENWWNKMILTPLAAGVIRNDVPLIRELLRMGANPFDNSAFYMCAVLDMPDIATLLLSAFKSRYSNKEPCFGCDTLYQIIRRKNMRLLRLLATDMDITGPVLKDLGPKPSSQPRFSSVIFTSPLGEAIRLHSESNGADGGALDYLLSLVENHNAIVHRHVKRGSMTGLLYAISLGSLETVSKLYQACTKTLLPTPRTINRTPLQAAAQAGKIELVEYFLLRGASPNEPPPPRAGATALQLAAITGHVGIAATLLKAGADINAPPAFSDGRTAFEGATEHGRIAMMMFLVGEGADLLANSNGQYRRAIAFAEDNQQYAAKDLADKLFARALVSQQAGFIDMGEPLAGSDMPDFGTLSS